MIPSTIPPSNVVYSENKQTTTESRFSRCIKKIASYTYSVLKTAGVASLIFGLLAAPVVNAQLNHTSSNQLLKTIEPLPFPAYTAWFMNPGIQLARNGSAACNINTCLEPKKVCESITTSVLMQLEQKRTFDAIDQTNTYRQKGVVGNNMVVNGITRRLHFRINTRRFDNYEKALTYIEKTVFANPLLFLTPPKVLLTTLSTLHSILTSNLPDKAIITPGNFRTVEKIYSPEELHIVKDTAKKGLTDSEYAIWDQSRVNIEATNATIFTDKERAIWNRIFFTGSNPKQIEQELLEFAEKFSSQLLKNFYNDELELDEKSQQQASIKLAAYVHTQLIKIHPFLIANGRIARLFMHTILRYYGGFDPLVLQDETAYHKATKESFTNPQAFETYITDQLIPWTEEQKYLLFRKDEFTTFYSIMKE